MVVSLQSEIIYNFNILFPQVQTGVSVVHKFVNGNIQSGGPSDFIVIRNFFSIIDIFVRHLSQVEQLLFNLLSGRFQFYMYLIRVPPSTVIAVPLIMSDLSLSRNRMGLITSLTSGKGKISNLLEFLNCH